jgi:hypothetical protein
MKSCFCQQKIAIGGWTSIQWEWTNHLTQGRMLSNWIAIHKNLNHRSGVLTGHMFLSFIRQSDGGEHPIV